MIIKILGAIAAIIVIIMSIFVVLKINFEENKDNSISDVDKFVGKWKLISAEVDSSEDEIPDISEESDNIFDYETYGFLSNGTYYNVVDEVNSSGAWEINNSILVLTVGDPFGVLYNYYEFVFSEDNHRVTLNLVDNPENFLEFEKISG